MKVAVLLALLASSAWAESLPQPPCEGREVSPAYPEVDRPPVVKVWEDHEQGHDWRPPSCTGWAEPGFSTLVATVARFHYAGGREALLRRIGAISELKGLEYWSTTHQQWGTLILDAFALSGPSADQRRGDFSPQELTAGRACFFEQEDSLSGKGIFEMHLRAASEGRLVFDTTNVSTLRFLMVPIFHPGEVQSIYFLESESKDVWRYYNLARTGKNANLLTTGHAASSINRAAAFYRHLAGIPPDKNSPDAR
jgi:hypothetical protein